MAAILLSFVVGCATVKIEAPEKPITINLNVKVEHSIDVKVDEQLEKVITKNPEVF